MKVSDTAKRRARSSQQAREKNLRPACLLRHFAPPPRAPPQFHPPQPCLPPCTGRGRASTAPCACSSSTRAPTARSGRRSCSRTRATRVRLMGGGLGGVEAGCEQCGGWSARGVRAGLQGPHSAGTRSRPLLKIGGASPVACGALALSTMPRASRAEHARTAAGIGWEARGGAGARAGAGLSPTRKRPPPLSRSAARSSPRLPPTQLPHSPQHTLITQPPSPPPPPTSSTPSSTPPLPTPPL